MNKDTKAQTYAAREARESQRGFTYEWLRALFKSGMEQQQWATRAEAARWLTEESKASATISNGPQLCASDEESRGYSRDLYLKLSQWEIELSLIYRDKLTPAPAADPDAEFTVFDRPQKT